MVIIEADSREEAIDKFLGDAEELEDDEFIPERLGFIYSILWSIPEDDYVHDFYPLAEKLKESIDNVTSNPYKYSEESKALLKGKEFRELAKKVFQDDLDEITIPNDIFIVLPYEGLHKRSSRKKTKRLLKANDKRELRNMFNYYCENLSNNNKINELYGMARAMKIKNVAENRDDKAWLCSQIGAQLVIHETGIHAQNLAEALNN